MNLLIALHIIYLKEAKTIGRQSLVGRNHKTSETLTPGIGVRISNSPSENNVDNQASSLVVTEVPLANPLMDNLMSIPF